ncbi:MAG: hypothetical protein NTW61_01570 [Candidatus Melainabacteria bacterium]|nr:hypothetical protein [Candidatus Melainabacteria bacterium]
MNPPIDLNTTGNPFWNATNFVGRWAQDYGPELNPPKDPEYPEGIGKNIMGFVNGGANMIGNVASWTRDRVKDVAKAAVDHPEVSVPIAAVGAVAAGIALAPITTAVVLGAGAVGAITAAVVAPHTPAIAKAWDDAGKTCNAAGKWIGDRWEDTKKIAADGLDNLKKTPDYIAGGIQNTWNFPGWALAETSKNIADGVKNFSDWTGLSPKEEVKPADRPTDEKTTDASVTPSATDKATSTEAVKSAEVKATDNTVAGKLAFAVGAGVTPAKPTEVAKSEVKMADAGTSTAAKPVEAVKPASVEPVKSDVKTADASASTPEKSAEAVKPAPAEAVKPDVKTADASAPAPEKPVEVVAPATPVATIATDKPTEPAKPTEVASAPVAPAATEKLAEVAPTPVTPVTPVATIAVGIGTAPSAKSPEAVA